MARGAAAEPEAALHAATEVSEPAPEPSVVPFLGSLLAPPLWEVSLLRALVDDHAESGRPEPVWQPDRWSWLYAGPEGAGVWVAPDWQGDWALLGRFYAEGRTIAAWEPR